MPVLDPLIHSAPATDRGLVKPEHGLLSTVQILGAPSIVLGPRAGYDSPVFDVKGYQRFTMFPAKTGSPIVNIAVWQYDPENLALSGRLKSLPFVLFAATAFFNVGHDVFVWSGLDLWSYAALGFVGINLFNTSFGTPVTITRFTIAFVSF